MTQHKQAILGDFSDKKNLVNKSVAMETSSQMTSEMITNLPLGAETLGS